MNNTTSLLAGGIVPGQTMAKPLHLQRLEASLDMGPFMSYARNILSQPLTSSESDESEVDVETVNPGDKFISGVKTSKIERRSDKMHLYNFSQVGSERKWLHDLLLTDTDSESEVSDEDDYIREMLRSHAREQKYREMYYKVANNSQFGYYGTGLLSNSDMFPEHQESIVGLKKRRKEREKKADKPKPSKIRKQNNLLKGKLETTEIDAEMRDIDWDDSALNSKDDLEDELDSKPQSPASGIPTKRSRKRSALPKTPEVMAARRRKVWQLMAKKELGKVQRAKANNHKEMLQGCKRVATMCMKIIRQRAMQSQKIMKETLWRAKRLTREMQGYWKRYDRVERETRRRMEKEAEEQRKLDVELIEAKRQQRKLNFLITQTELYAHFMSKKLGHGTEEEQLRILNQLDEELNPRLAAIDDYNSELMKQRAEKNAKDAFTTDKARTEEFDMIAQPALVAPEIGTDGVPEYPQPTIFKGVLKGYQLKGMTWLANLYDQGISGILADEMGLGKTVQSIAFLCHIAERYGVWGPFLIISPASTLHNWQQEMQRFVPDFNVVPYWGSPNERKILRQFWEQKDLHTKDASFHVVITSYQLVVSDLKYFNRIKWQYMVLDEAQAIKSSTSVRWKLLLGFSCRNRLLLSGTPIQNSMAELWALLHFIMPTLFDSHDEFNEWFSKDIESHAENKTGIDERQISRLHMILKPFMLRRIKKDVENELSDKIEIMVYCPLTTRQKLLYMALKKKIRIEDLLHFTVGGGDGHCVDKNFTSNLMNLVMQFRKVCNHPELFERRDAKSPFSMKCQEYVIPRLIFNDGILKTCLPSKKHLVYNRFSIFKAENVQRSCFPRLDGDKTEKYKRYVDLNLDNSFAFSRFTNLTPNEIENTALGGLINYLQYCFEMDEQMVLQNYRKSWWEGYNCIGYLLLEPTMERVLDKRFLSDNSILRKFLFTAMVSSESTVYTFGDYQTYNMQETIEHRVIRSKNRRDIDIKPSLTEAIKEEVKEEPMEEDIKPIVTSPARGRPPSKSTMDRLPKSPSTTLLPEFLYFPRPPQNYKCEALSMPRFVYGVGPKVQATGRKQYCDSRAAQWAYIRHEQCENAAGYNLVHSSLEICRPNPGWSYITIPDKQTLVSDAGKLSVLDNLLTRLKAQGHRVLIYSQMTKMIDLLEEYMWHRKHRYMRLDGSSKISARRDMVADFQSRADIFVFLLSTRAGGLGINLTAADTVIFYDSDWNPTVDQQAMDRAHRLGQTKQVTVYRLICKGTIEERILQRAREKSEIQRMVISGGNFKPDTLKPKEVVSLLLDDEEIELKYRQKTEERKQLQEDPSKFDKSLDRKRKMLKSSSDPPKRVKFDLSTSFASGSDAGNTTNSNNLSEDNLNVTGGVGGNLLELADGSPTQSEKDFSGGNNKQLAGNTSDILIPGATVATNDDSSNEALIVDCDSPSRDNTPVSFSYGTLGRPRRRHHPRGTKRGRPRGSRRGGGTGSLGRSDTTPPSSGAGALTSTPSGAGGTSTPSIGSPGEQLTNTGEGSFTPVVPPVKRGPGRPRLKPGGPPNQGYRGVPRTRKPIGPLVVPLGQSPAATPLTRSPAMSPAPSPAPERGSGDTDA